jgi:hypothetical protein
MLGVKRSEALLSSSLRGPELERARKKATLGSEMGSWLDRRRTRRLSSAPSPSFESRQQTGSAYEIRFVPARWLVLLLGVAWTVLSGGRVAKLSLVGLVWSVTPRPVRVAAAGLAVTWMIVVAGALAAIILLALQIG